jgi:WD40 repeat protein
VGGSGKWFDLSNKMCLTLRGSISVGSLDVKPTEQDSRRLVHADLGGAYVPASNGASGHLLFLRGQTLMAQPFDARHLSLAGDPVRVVEEPVGQYLDSGLFSVSTTGILVYWSPGNVESQLTWLDAHGKVLRTVGPASPYGELALSPDGTQAALSKYTLPEQHHTLWLLDLSRGTSTRFELDPSTENGAPVWMPDGRTIIFGSAHPGQMMDIYQKPTNGAASAEVVIKSNDWKTPLSVSPDASFLLYSTVGGETKGDLWLLPLRDHRKPVVFLHTEFDEPDGRFSPDGHWIAYVSNESGRYEVYVRPFLPDALGESLSSIGNKQLISNGGGFGPRWREDGKVLYYIDLDGRLMAVEVSTGAAFRAGVPSALFPTPAMTEWAPSPDGKHFLFLVTEARGQVPFTIVLNWRAGLGK